MTELATFAAGCFWGVQKHFDDIAGVLKTTVGFTGGLVKNPSYRDVCHGDTGHAEAVLIEFDIKKVSYQALLDAFFAMHNPTTQDRQGPDIGSQYRSAVFYHNNEQKQLAQASKQKIKDAVTQIAEAKLFYPAEEYHQKYLEKKSKT